MPNPLPNLLSELRGGAVVLAVLSRLEREQYGYALSRELAEKGLEVEQGTLYPLLRRLEKQGLLESRWRIEGERPRRYYRLGPGGKDVLRGLGREWKALVHAIEEVLS